MSLTEQRIRIDADLESSVSPPRENGELVFAAPWERRVFGLTIALCRSGQCDWEQFRSRLIHHIAVDGGRDYWRSWATALEDVLATDTLVQREELDERQQRLSRRPVGFDH
jgi:nitrile hydratase accessory protein